MFLLYSPGGRHETEVRHERLILQRKFLKRVMMIMTAIMGVVMCREECEHFPVPWTRDVLLHVVGGTKPCPMSKCGDEVHEMEHWTAGNHRLVHNCSL
jgi:hypothetical protein